MYQTTNSKWGGKRLLLLSLFWAVAMVITAQPHHKTFDPQKFETDLEQFVISEAGITQQESVKFLPVYRKMRQQQRQLMSKLQKYRQANLNDEKLCEEAIRTHDEVDIQVKKLQQEYHKRLLKTISAKKLLRVIRAEDKFHRRAFKGMARPKKGK